MQRFEITVDGVTEGSDFATQAEANAALPAIQKAKAGHIVAVRTKGTGSVAPVADNSHSQTHPERR